MSTNAQGTTVVPVTPTNELKAKVQITQTREQLFKLLEKEKANAKELLADIKAIVALVKEFKEKVGIPDKGTLGWAISNRKAIFALIQNIVIVLRVKNAI